MNDRVPRRPSSARIRSAVRAERLSLAGVAIAVLVRLLLYRTGAIADQENTLQVMGFDPDRAVLISSLLVGATGSAIVALVGGRFRIAIVTGAAFVVVGFWRTFRHETGTALKARPPDGVFDPAGWALTILSILVVALIVGWAAAILGADGRAGLRAAGLGLRSLVRTNGKPREGIRRVVTAILIIVLLALTAPIFGDMMNFGPDVHMLRAAPAQVGLFGGSSTASPAASLAPGTSAAASLAPGTSPLPKPAAALVAPPDLVPGPVAGSLVTAGALSRDRPWLSHLPTGGGRTYSVDLPAPWVGGIRDHATIDIYLPPGYDAGTARYPVIYEPHQPLWAWQRGMHFTSILDSLIRDGTIPPEIVVFVDQLGGPYADSQCADSWDGKEWFDRYFGQIVPAWADANLRTIATPAGRSILGFSSGGYCAAAAITHHPDIFNTALIFSGYFVAGIRTTTTPTAYRPFNGDPVIEKKQSPINVVPTISASIRASLFVALSADPSNKFYGAQITDFAKVLDANGVAVAILPSQLGHSWASVREQIPAALSMLAARQVTLGVFSANK